MWRKSFVAIALTITLLALGASQGVAVELRDVHFINLNRGWAVGDGGILLKTADGGAEWEEVDNGVEYDLNSIRFSNPKVGCIVGNRGTLIHTVDGGETWLRREIRTKHNLNGIFYADQDHGWVVGDEGTILATTDGGKTWSPQKSETPNNLTGVHFIDAKEGWVVGLRGTILHTTNGGEIWEAQSIGTALGESKPQYQRTRRTKGSPIQSLTSVHFANPQRGWATGLFGLLLTTDNGGKTWKSQDVGLRVGRWGKRVSLKDIHLHGMEQGCIVGEGGTLVHTNDGNKWYPRNLQISSRLNSVFFIDHQHGWAVGDNFTILRTTNGGNTWQVQM